MKPKLARMCQNGPKLWQNFKNILYDEADDSKYLHSEVQNDKLKSQVINGPNVILGFCEKFNPRAIDPYQHAAQCNPFAT